MTGPTPPGTGVIADATLLADSKSTSPDDPAVHDVDADVDDDRALAQHLPGDEAGLPGGHDDDLRVLDMAREVAPSSSGRS